MVRPGGKKESGQIIGFNRIEFVGRKEIGLINIDENSKFNYPLTLCKEHAENNTTKSTGYKNMKLHVYQQARLPLKQCSLCGFECLRTP